MRTTSIAVAAVVLSLTIAGCALAPRNNLRLEEARVMLQSAHADSQLARLAPEALARAEDTFYLADTARTRLDDPAVVDHLAYVAKQRLAIARQLARTAAARERTLIGGL